MKASDYFKGLVFCWYNEGGPPLWPEDFHIVPLKDNDEYGGLTAKILALIEAVEKVPACRIEEDASELGPFDRGDAILRAALALKEKP